MKKGMKKHTLKESEWDKDSWCVSIVAEAMTFARTQPIGRDASHITRKLRKKVSQVLSTREKEIAEEIKKIKTAGHDECNDDFLMNVLKILNHK